MKRNILILRITLWLGIIQDLLMGVSMMIPRLFLKITGIQIIKSSEFSFGLMYGMPVMIGWAIILFWADRKPLERKSVLLCLIPVVMLYIVIEIIGISKGFLAFENIILSFISQAVLIILSIYSYVKNKSV